MSPCLTRSLVESDGERDQRECKACLFYCTLVEWLVFTTLPLILLLMFFGFLGLSVVLFIDTDHVYIVYKTRNVANYMTIVLLIDTYPVCIAYNTCDVTYYVTIGFMDAYPVYIAYNTCDVTYYMTIVFYGYLSCIHCLQYM